MDEVLKARLNRGQAQEMVRRKKAKKEIVDPISKMELVSQPKTKPNTKDGMGKKE